MPNCSSATSTRVQLERFRILLESNVRGLARVQFHLFLSRHADRRCSRCACTQVSRGVCRSGLICHRPSLHLALSSVQTGLSATLRPLCLVFCPALHTAPSTHPPPFAECRVPLDTPADRLVCEGQSVDGNGDEVHRQTDATEILNTRRQTIITF